LQAWSFLLLIRVNSLKRKIGPAKKIGKKNTQEKKSRGEMNEIFSGSFEYSIKKEIKRKK
jgi:hypothetical protein